MSKIAIVCVDDQQIILECLQMQLERYYGDNFQLEFANTGVAALDTIESLKTSGINKIVVICDLNLGSIKGDELLSMIHAKYPDTGKILLSGYISTTLIEELKDKVKLNAYVYKPWDRQDLVKALDTTICDIMGWSYDANGLNPDVNKTAVLCISKNSDWKEAVNNKLKDTSCKLSFCVSPEEAIICIDELACAGVRHLVIVADWGINESDLIIDARSQFLSVKFVVMDGTDQHMLMSHFIKGVQLAGRFDSTTCVETACKVIKNAVSECVLC